MSLKVYSFDEVYGATKEYFNGDELATDVWIKKYCLKNDGGELLELTPDDTHRRLAKEFARVEHKYLQSLPKGDTKNLTPYGRSRYEKLSKLSLDGLGDYFYGFLKDYKYCIPGGSVIEGLGSGEPISISNCFFNGATKDSVDDIFEKAKSMAQVGKRRGGTSTDISHLRPSGTTIKNSAKISTGPISWMELFDVTGKVVGQQHRKMAMMITMDVNHPDIEEFILCKQNTNKITNANISVKLNNSFIKAARNAEDYILRWPCSVNLNSISYPCDINSMEYNKLYPCVNTTDNSAVYIKKIKASAMWDKLVNSAHSFAEPGILNWDRVIDYDPTSQYTDLKPVGTNPCSELPLGEGDSCRLICSNLYSLVENPFSEHPIVNENVAKEVFYEALCICDLIVDLEIEAVDRILNKINPIYSIEKISGKAKPEFDLWLNQQNDEFKLWWGIREKGVIGRRTGVGCTAYGDFCAALGVAYGDEKATNDIHKLKFETELDASIDMSIIKGSFPIWSDANEFNTDGGLNSWYEFIRVEFPNQTKRMRMFGRRNSGISTYAPCGTLSIQTQTTSGIEPLFMPFYKRRKKASEGEKPDFVDTNGVGFMEFMVVHPKLKEYITTKYDVSLSAIEKLTEDEISEYYKNSPYFGQIANEIKSDVRVKTQNLIQKYVTSSISSTVNLPSTATAKDVKDIYEKAFDGGCKGITVYVDGSRSGVLVSTKDKKTKCEDFVTNNAPKRPKELDADFYKVKSKGKTFIVLVGLLCGRPYEIFVFEPDFENIIENTPLSKLSQHRGKIIKVKRGQYKFTSEHIEIPNLQLVNTLEEKTTTLYISMLLRHGAPITHILNVMQKIDDNIASFSSVIRRILSKYEGVKEVEGELCPDCGGRLVRESGCVHCIDCSWSRCG